MRELLTTRQVAVALGVSEASLKRWCDKGLLAVTRTPGGHRRIPAHSVVQFVREQGHTLERPEVLGLPPAIGRSGAALDTVRAPMRTALEEGDEIECRRLILGLYLDGHPAHAICDRAVAPAFREIGERWAHGAVEVYEERRAVELCTRTLYQLRNLLPDPVQEAPTAIGATLAGDPYTLPTTMVEIALVEAGWQARSYGAGHPVGTLCAALATVQPRLFWLSVSALGSEAEFIAEYRQLYEAATRAGSAIALGGRVVTPTIREAIQYAAFCDNLAHVVSYAASLREHRPAAGPPIEERA